MKLVDAHIHLSDSEYKNNVAYLIEDAKESGIKALATNSMDLKTCRSDLELAKKYPNLVCPVLGIHPWNVNAISEFELETTIELIQNNRTLVKAIGEIGLDCKYETVWEKQMMVFDKMLRLAESLQLPVIIHSRGTTDKIIEILQSYKLKNVVLHWFSFPISTLEKAIDKGYLITEGPPVTYSKSLREIVEKVPLKNFLTETDGPVKYWKNPFNGEMTKPSYVSYVVKAVAEIKRLPVDYVAEQIIHNFEAFFGVKVS